MSGSETVTMNMSSNNSHAGLKVKRLQYIKNTESLRDLVLPVFTISPLPIAEYGNAKVRDIVSMYSAALERASPDLADCIQNVCGPAPWIIRSDGNEDAADHINAGGYQSKICSCAKELFQAVAEVATSGLTEHAKKQQRLMSEGCCDAAPIPCFVQPLMNIGLAGNIDADQSPYLQDCVLDDMESACRQIMDVFGFPAIDCEWGLETELGFVSVTTIMPRYSDLMNVSHTIGFGFSSAQNSGSTATSLALKPANSELRLWRGRYLRETNVRRMYLFQARPAQFDGAYRECNILTKSCRDTLARHYNVLEAGLLMLGDHWFGRALVAPNLMTAWHQYLALESGDRSAVALVLVDTGSAEEHAGIMFRQQKITCVCINISGIPVGADYAIYDRGSCIVGDVSILRSIQAECRRELVIPDCCALVFTEDMLMWGEKRGQRSKSALLYLDALQVAPETRERLAIFSEQPHCSRWIHYSNGVVQSPSLLAAIWRSNHSDCRGKARALSKFSKRYYRASQASAGTMPLAPTILSALSISARKAFTGCLDFRITMALIDLEAAASWVPLQTLHSIVSLASYYLELSDHNSALLILSSVHFTRAECERLPIYSQEDAISYLLELVKDLQHGLSIDGLLSIRSLDLPISSASALARQTSSNSEILKRMTDFKGLLVSFRNFLLCGDRSGLYLQHFNWSYIALRTTLCEVGLGGVAEQVKGSVIEMYDASLKALLIKVVDGLELKDYYLYIVLMRSWIGLLRGLVVPEKDASVLQCFDAWLTLWFDEELPATFDIQDRNWQLEFRSIVDCQGAFQRYENPHVVHNLLHQYSLASLQLDSSQLPIRVQELEQFCSTFSNRSTKVLRFERELLEIQIPMGTHKASYMVTPKEIAVEWTEPPDCPAHKIARIIAFEVLLKRFAVWVFPTLTVRREQVLGTWTLHIRLRIDGSSLYSFERLKLFIVSTRFLFDASYDFSYTANEVAERAGHKFHGIEWQAMFEVLIRHRELIDDASQYVALHALPMSSTIGAIVQNGTIRAMLLRCRRRGFAYCREVIERYDIELNDSKRDSQKWSFRYEILRQACLFQAASWPRESLLDLAGRSAFGAGEDLIAACLLKRSDMTHDLRRIVMKAPAVLSGISGLIVRHSPEVAVTAFGPQLLALELAYAGVHFRRAKHFLISRFGDQLSHDALSALIRPLDVVPWGHTAKIERAIESHFLDRPSVYRFHLDKGIDWTALDSWKTLEQTYPAPSLA